LSNAQKARVNYAENQASKSKRTDSQSMVDTDATLHIILDGGYRIYQCLFGPAIN
jgi:hypothetical protein